MANADGCDAGIFKKELAIEFGVKIVAPIRFLSDSLSTVMLHKDFFSCNKSKHIARAIAVLREKIRLRVYEMLHIPGTENYADILTMAPERSAFVKFRDAILGAKINYGAAIALTAQNMPQYEAKYARIDKQS